MTDTAIASDAIGESRTNILDSVMDQADQSSGEAINLPEDHSSAASSAASKMPLSVAEIGRLTNLKVAAAIAAQKRVREESLKRNPRSWLKGRELEQLQKDLEELGEIAKYWFYQNSGHPVLRDEVAKWLVANPSQAHRFDC